MAKWRRLLGFSSKADMEGISLDLSKPHWEVNGPSTFEALLRALIGLFPEEAMMYFEGGHPDDEIERFIKERAVPEVSHVAMGTIWPRPRVFHVPARAEVLNELAAIMDHHAEPELAIHFHVYHRDQVLLQWYDSFSPPLLLAGSLPERRVADFAHRFGGSYRGRH